MTNNVSIQHKDPFTGAPIDEAPTTLRQWIDSPTFSSSIEFLVQVCMEAPEESLGMIRSFLTRRDIDTDRTMRALSTARILMIALTTARRRGTDEDTIRVLRHTALRVFAETPLLRHLNDLRNVDDKALCCALERATLAAYELRMLDQMLDQLTRRRNRIRGRERGLEKACSELELRRMRLLEGAPARFEVADHPWAQGQTQFAGLVINADQLCVTQSCDLPSPDFPGIHAPVHWVHVRAHIQGGAIIVPGFRATFVYTQPHRAVVESEVGLIGNQEASIEKGGSHDC